MKNRKLLTLLGIVCLSTGFIVGCSNNPSLGMLSVSDLSVSKTGSNLNLTGKYQGSTVKFINYRQDGIDELTSSAVGVDGSFISVMPSGPTFISMGKHTVYIQALGANNTATQFIRVDYEILN